MYEDTDTERVRAKTRRCLPNSNEVVTKGTCGRGTEGNAASAIHGLHLPHSRDRAAASVETRAEKGHKTQDTSNHVDIASLPSLAIPKRHKLPEISAVYFVLERDGKLEYIGQSKNLRQRWRDGHRCCADLAAPTQARVAWLEIADETERQILEKHLISKYQPRLNCQYVPAVKPLPKTATQAITQLTFDFTDNASVSEELLSEELFTTNQAAAMAEVSSARIRQLILDGYITPRRVGRDHLLTMKDIKKGQARRSQRGPAKGAKYTKRTPKTAQA